MATPEPYEIDGRKYSRDETLEWIRQFRKSIQRRGDRHVVNLGFIPSGSTVLDYGCGMGTFGLMMWEKGCNVLGIDLDAKSLRIAKEITGERERLHFEQKSILEIPDNSFDIVVSMQ